MLIFAILNINQIQKKSCQDQYPAPPPPHLLVWPNLPLSSLSCIQSLLISLTCTHSLNCHTCPWNFASPVFVPVIPRLSRPGKTNLPSILEHAPMLGLGLGANPNPNPQSFTRHRGKPVSSFHLSLLHLPQSQSPTSAQCEDFCQLRNFGQQGIIIIFSKSWKAVGVWKPANFRFSYSF